MQGATPEFGLLARHRLAPLLMPRRVALVGASPKEGTVGNGMIVAVTLGERRKSHSWVSPGSQAAWQALTFKPLDKIHFHERSFMKYTACKPSSGRSRAALPRPVEQRIKREERWD